MENAWIIPLVIYYAILAFWKHILAAVGILLAAYLLIRFRRKSRKRKRRG